MPQDTRNQEADRSAPDPPEIPFGSSEVRLAPGEWAVALVFLAAVAWFVPVGWQRIEPLPAGPDVRIPFRLGYDYWTFDRFCRRACDEPQVLVVGDSVVWGHYVDPGETLSHYLSELDGDRRFANLGVDGIHPVALAGLVEHYGHAISGRRVVLNANLLWMSSKRRDLQVAKEFAFNHPELVPQVLPKVVLDSLRGLAPDAPPDVRCYKASGDDRLGVVARRTVPFLRWTRHLQVAYFDDVDLPAWTIEHPDRNPAAAITLQLPSPDEPPSPPPVAKPWTEQGIPQFNPAWVELETSLQWQYFRRAIRTLEARGNRVFVVVGPFNEHMLTEESLGIYQKRKQEAAAWLRENRIPHAVPPALPSQLYADASHPLAEGYRVLAEQLLADKSFDRFLETQ